MLKRYCHQKWRHTFLICTMLKIFLGSISTCTKRSTIRFQSAGGSNTNCLFFGTFASALSNNNNNINNNNKIAVIGGGASGIFASIAAAEHEHTKVTVLEATSQTLQKVKISGGGRCNVMHDTSKTVPTILNGYPRGKKELNGLYNKRFSPTMAREWFEYRGVTLKTEPDGRMFPITDSSMTIIETLTNAAQEEGVEIRKKSKVEGIVQTEEGGEFELTFKDGSKEIFSSVILATGSAPLGYKLSATLGHDVVKPTPSLFTLNCKHAIKEDGVLHSLSGVSVPTARVSLSKKEFQEGPLLITHHGVSGPAALRLSAFAAKEFQELNYQTEIKINWDTEALGTNVEKVFEQLWKVTQTNPKRTVASVCPLPQNSIPRRLWSSLVLTSGFQPDTVWGNASKKLVRKLANNLVACPLEVTSKGTFKEEFVTAGGVSLKELDMKTMGSKKCPGLFFCGELINVDGVTGGFNFMNCWATGFVAGHSSADYIYIMCDGQED